MSDGQETSIHIDAKGIQLEGRLASPVRDRAAIITHPHPQYGGNMNNPVVDAIVGAYLSRDWTTLRFNFRGTGSSQGNFDQGRGEQIDIQAAIDFLAQAGAKKIDLAGYSFGAWVISLWAQAHTDHDHDIRLIAPPVAFMDYQAVRRIAGLSQIIVGGRDQIAPAATVEEMMQIWQPSAELWIIEHADHFFQDHLQELHTTLVNCVPV